MIVSRKGEEQYNKRDWERSLERKNEVTEEEAFSVRHKLLPLR
jgi:hypothetical protein